MSSFPDVKEKEEMRKIVGRYGITGREQVGVDVLITLVAFRIAMCIDFYC